MSEQVNEQMNTPKELAEKNVQDVLDRERMERVMLYDTEPGSYDEQLGIIHRGKYDAVPLIYPIGRNPKIAAALCKVAAELKNPKKDKTATIPTEKNGVKKEFTYHYSSLDTVINESRPVLAKYGLCIMQIPQLTYTTDNRGYTKAEVTIHATIWHESGETLTVPDFTMQTTETSPQKIGSIITYARRYQLGAILGISPEEDDDAADVSKPEPKQKEKPIRKCTADEINALTQFAQQCEVSPRALGGVVKHDYKKAVTDLTLDELGALMVRLMNRAQQQKQQPPKTEGSSEQAPEIPQVSIDAL